MFMAIYVYGHLCLWPFMFMAIYVYGHMQKWFKDSINDKWIPLEANCSS